MSVLSCSPSISWKRAYVLWGLEGRRQVRVMYAVFLNSSGLERLLLGHIKPEMPKARPKRSAISNIRLPDFTCRRFPFGSCPG